jgi:hypothetical protein
MLDRLERVDPLADHLLRHGDTRLAVPIDDGLPHSLKQILLV